MVLVVCTKGNFPKLSHILTIRRHHFVAFYHQKVSVQGKFFKAFGKKLKQMGKFLGAT